MLTDSMQGKIHDVCKLVCVQLLWLPLLSRSNKLLLNAFHWSIQHHQQRSNSLNGVLEVWNINDRRHSRKVWVMAERLTEILGIRLTINPGNQVHAHLQCHFSLLKWDRIFLVLFLVQCKAFYTIKQTWFYILCLFMFIHTFHVASKFNPSCN